jgi:cytochrome P450
MHILGRKFIILNSRKAVMDLFEERGALYSDRPRTVMAHDLVGKSHAILFSPYGERLKKHRRFLRNALDARRAPEYWDMQAEETRRLVVGLADDPDNFILHLRR